MKNSAKTKENIQETCRSRDLDSPLISFERLDSEVFLGAYRGGLETHCGIITKETQEPAKEATSKSCLPALLSKIDRKVY
jgi:hypothetical protein